MKFMKDMKGVKDSSCVLCSEADTSNLPTVVYQLNLTAI
jgi:hypothetical protein